MQMASIVELFRLIGAGDMPACLAQARSVAEQERQTNIKASEVLLGALGCALGQGGVAISALGKGSVSDTEINPLDLLSITQPYAAPSYMLLHDSIEDKFQRIVRQYRNLDKLKSKKLFHIRKLLLYGPPGCGKTLGANRLCRDLDLPLAKVKLDTIVSKNNLGASLRNLRLLFEYATNTACVLLIDECDFIARARSNSTADADMNRIVNVLLVLLDEYVGDSIIIATTNLESALDPALFRRFDLVLQIPLPTKEDSIRIIGDTIKSYKMYLDRGVDLRNYLHAIRGKNAAYVVRIATDSVKQAIMQDSQIVTGEHLATAIAEVCML